MHIMQPKGRTKRGVKLCEFEAQHNYSDELKPVFNSQYDSFFLTLKNLNYSGKTIHDFESSWAEGAHDRAYDEANDTAQDKFEIIVSFCDIPRTKDEIMRHIGLSSKRQFNERYMKQLLKSGRLLMALPDKPRSRNRKYIAAR